MSNKMISFSIKHLRLSHYSSNCRLLAKKLWLVSGNTDGKETHRSTFNKNSHPDKRYVVQLCMYFPTYATNTSS
jgi:hypothetical protein